MVRKQEMPWEARTTAIFPGSAQIELAGRHGRIESPRDSIAKSLGNIELHGCSQERGTALLEKIWEDVFLANFPGTLLEEISMKIIGIVSSSNFLSNIYRSSRIINR